MEINEIQSEINALKILLAQTDYVALKVAEAEMYGEDMSEFAAVIEQRRAWRRKINELEQEATDYAEYFEWADENPNNEDRCGLLVELDGDKIRLANGDDILGAISGRASVIGNAAELRWNGKLKTDLFGRTILDEDGKPMLSDDYNADLTYISRSQRPEWGVVGMVGRLIVIDDGSAGIGSYCTAENGIAVKADHKTNVRVLKRLDDSHIEVLIK